MAQKSLNQIRETFLKYFEKNDHKIVESSNLVPNNDPTLMFANSGMVQFKNVFTGLEKRDYQRATTSQKCVRAGGKHNDLENVGYTPRHHTFFEMLGNFSFGDYFKEKAIHYAWDLITKDFGIDKNKLYVTVFHEDDEAFNYWKKIAGLSEDRIIRISTSDNFWSMGETGPCGPCSEIFYDHGEHLKGGLPGTKDEDGDRFIEIWNLVFMQYEQVSKDKRIDLPKPSVDTGMGLERIAALLQGTHDNYETDHFKKLIQSTSEIVKKKPDENNLSSFRVIADHLRASSFLIAEGVLPSNEGRGYVLRRIMRRGMRHSHLLGSKEPVFYNLFETLKNEMSGNYPELKRADSLIKETLKMEEEKFLVLLDRGIKILNDEISKIDKELPGDVAFKLYDTYGFPLDLTEDILRNKSLSIDTKKFQSLMKESRELAKKNWKGSGDAAVENIWFGVRDKLGATEFLGYETDRAEGMILSLLKDNKEVKELKSNDEGMVITNQTPFYGESGGQVGDTGEIISGDFKFEVTDVQKKLGDLFVHYGKVISGSIKLNENVEMKINEKRRNDTRAYHSATHLLHESLRRVLGTHVTQKGSLVEPSRLRFDFSHMKPISNEDVEKIETFVNSMVAKKTDVRTRLMTPDEAVENGALALFGEKYGEEVRVLSMGDDGGKYFSTELCGGTHVKNTSEIWQFKIKSEGAIASGIRRVEAITFDSVKEYYSDKENEYVRTKKLLNNSGDIVKSVTDLLDENERLRKEMDQFLKEKTDLIKHSIKSEIIDKDGVKFISKTVSLNPSSMKDLIFSLGNELEDLFAILISEFNSKIYISCYISKNLVESKGLDAREVINELSKHVKANGGGQPFYATAGGDYQKGLNKLSEESQNYHNKI